MRKLPGALGHEDSAAEESFSRVLEGMPEYPHYTRPPAYRGWEVPEVLVSGDHERVRSWRVEQSRARAEQFESGAGVGTIRATARRPITAPAVFSRRLLSARKFQ